MQIGGHAIEVFSWPPSREIVCEVAAEGSFETVPELAFARRGGDRAAFATPGRRECSVTTALTRHLPIFGMLRRYARRLTLDRFISPPTPITAPLLQTSSVPGTVDGERGRHPRQQMVTENLGQDRGDELTFESISTATIGDGILQRHHFESMMSLTKVETVSRGSPCLFIDFNERCRRGLRMRCERTASVPEATSGCIFENPPPRPDPPGTPSRPVRQRGTEL